MMNEFEIKIKSRFKEMGRKASDKNVSGRF